jgi:hypothetical protein
VFSGNGGDGCDDGSGEVGEDVGRADGLTVGDRVSSTVREDDGKVDGTEYLSTVGAFEGGQVGDPDVLDGSQDGASEG